MSIPLEPQLPPHLPEPPSSASSLPRLADSDLQPPDPAPLGQPDQFYIRIHPHPRAGLKDTTISLDSPASHSPVKAIEGLRHDEISQLDPLTAPWFPFKNRPEFEVTRLAVQGGLSKEFMDDLVAGVTTSTDAYPDSRPGYQPPMQWFKGEGKVTFKNHKDVLAAADRSAAYTEEVGVDLFIQQAKNKY
jgi:hypothetical protein